MVIGTTSEIVPFMHKDTDFVELVVVFLIYYYESFQWCGVHLITTTQWTRHSKYMFWVKTCFHLKLLANIARNVNVVYR